ncbi:MAG: radical SAM protein [Lachnospiraceae bacterium]|nr:radical SAM protein [Lachnospiraceae bacterium]
MKDIEIGLIRPPSESESLLVRVTRGCHWNKCNFCGLYKSMNFSMRPIEEIIKDIEKQAALYQGKKFKSCFLQDGDVLVLKTGYLFRILEALNKNFPDLEYITSYARADSITRKSPKELRELRQAGLNHLYCGMETGSDKILQLINKGFHADTVVKSGCMAKEAGMILSEFILLGIGGKELSEENAIQTAEALNIIQPDFIRVHATGIKPESKMWEFVQDGSFTLQSEEEIVIEQKLFLRKLCEMNSYYVNEHIINLLLEVRGNLQTDKMKMMSTIDKFLRLLEAEKLLFIIGRRFNIFFMLTDLKNPGLYQKVQECRDKILQKNPQVDFTKLCNYIRQSQI